MGECGILGVHSHADLGVAAASKTGERVSLSGDAGWVAGDRAPVGGTVRFASIAARSTADLLRAQSARGRAVAPGAGSRALVRDRDGGALQPGYPGGGLPPVFPHK